MGYTLDNAEKRAAKYPTTFELPSAAERKNLKKGDLVKCIFLAAKPIDGLEGDRMWVEVKKRVGDQYIGELANDPTIVDAKLGDEVRFGPEHVIMIRPGN
jgi:hypothetical protein